MSERRRPVGRVPPRSSGSAVGRVPSHGAAPTGRKKLARDKERGGRTQGHALGHESKNTSSPEGAKETGNIVLPELPKTGSYASVSEMGATDEQAVLTGPFGTNLGRGDFIESGIPLLTISCLTDRPS